MKLVVQPEAADELDEATDWYEQRAMGLGPEFRAAVRATLDAVLVNPRRFRRVLDDFRKAVMRRFPYSIYYWGGEDVIVVEAIYHGRRDPALLEPRLNEVRDEL